MCRAVELCINGKSIFTFQPCYLIGFLSHLDFIGVWPRAEPSGWADSQTSREKGPKWC